MEMRQAIRWLGCLALLGGAARIAMAPFAQIMGANSMAELTCGFIACVFMGIGIIGVYLYQAPRSGVSGWIATLTLAVTSTITAALVWNNMLGLQPDDHAYISALLPVNSILTLAGQLVFGLSAIRARIYPQWSLILLIVYPAIYYIPAISDLGSVAWGLCYVVFAYTMLQGQPRQAYSPTYGERI